MSRSGSTALHYAALRGMLKVMELLIKRGANIDSADSKGNTRTHRFPCVPCVCRVCVCVDDKLLTLVHTNQRCTWRP